MKTNHYLEGSVTGCEAPLFGPNPEVNNASPVNAGNENQPNLESRSAGCMVTLFGNQEIVNSNQRGAGGKQKMPCAKTIKYRTQAGEVIITIYPDKEESTCLIFPKLF